jgi:hypothetical protein
MMPAFRSNTGRNVSEVWREGHWRCELHPAAGGEARLKIFRGEKLEVLEPTWVGYPAYARAQVLRQLLCGNDGDGQTKAAKQALMWMAIEDKTCRAAPHILSTHD